MQTIIKKLRVTIRWILAAFFGSTILAVVALRFLPVYFTPLMFIRLAQQAGEGKELRLSHHWVPLHEISSKMPVAVIASEDANGLDAVKVTFDSGILFATNSSTLNASSQNTIKQIAQVLKNNSDVDVAIFGHTDSTGSDAINNPLSEKRAKAVENSLKTQGVTNIKTVEGQGSTNPVADNSTAEGRKQNRRVEVYMYASQKMIQEAQQQAN